jgi:iron complex transport system substrate-binding protein
MGASLASVALARLAGGAAALTPAAGWSFTDDKGVAISLDATPSRIASDLLMAAALWDFGVQPVAVFGWDVTADNTLGVGGGNIDPTAVDIVGNATEPLNLEAAIAVSPDLFTTFDGDPADPMSYWSIDPELLDDLQAVAPVLAINSNHVRTDLLVARIGELAAALGADLEGAGVSTAKADAETAAAEFVAAVEANPELTAIFIFANDNGIFVANPKVVSDLLYFAELRLKMPELDVADTEYWETLSWEQANKYPVDVIFTTERAPLSMDDLKANPVFSLLPAVQAGQIATWNDTHQLSYQGLAAALRETAAALATAQVLDGV